MNYIRTADGHLIQNTVVSNGSDKLVILSHGIATNKDEDGIYTKFAEEILAPHFDSIRFDFRGHGKSAIESRKASVSGEIIDFMAVVRWARGQGYKKLFHVGTSFGASITLLSIARFAFSDFSSFVFWNPVISYQNTFIAPTVEWAKEFFNQQTIDELAYRDGIPIPESDFIIGPIMIMELLNFRPEHTTWPAELPLLIIHGNRDTAVPCPDSVEYNKRNGLGTKVHVVKGVDHGFDQKISEVYELTLKWFEEHR